jgi:hypothetical protein
VENNSISNLKSDDVQDQNISKEIENKYRVFESKLKEINDQHSH